MARKRGNNEGSVYQRKDGLWVAAITTGAGKRVAYAKTRALAAQKLQQLQQQAGAGTLTTGGAATVEKLCAEYLEHKRPSWRPRSYEAAEGAVRLRIVPGLGSVRLDQLTPHRCQTWIRGMGQTRAAKIAWQHLHAACDLAVRWGWLARNPLDATDCPAPPRRKPVEVSRESVQAVLEATRETGDYVVVCLMLGCGLRISEAVGLRWQDWDKAGQTITVAGQRGRQSGEPAHVSPKTSQSVRTIALPSWVQAALEALPDPGEPAAMLYPHSSDVLRQRLARTLKRAGVEYVSPHTLRHAYASLLIDARLPITQVSAALGHSSPAVTMSIYAHKLGSVDRRTAEALEGLGKRE